MATRHQGHFARKRFGQNFLVDLAIVDAIVDAIGPRRDDLMLEIGPGLGALTGPLLERLDTLHAVELDRDLISRLTQRFGEKLVLHQGDALDFDFATVAPGSATSVAADASDVPVASVASVTPVASVAAGLTAELRSRPCLRVVGNLPYNISSPLLFRLYDFAPYVIDQHFMLQDEVVERMVAEPGSKTYGRLSVMLQYRYVIDKLLDVPPESFEPAPKVNSAIVRMIPHASSELAPLDMALFSQVVTAAFSQRRKMLRNTLGAYRERVDFEAMSFDLARRAEDVPVAEYVALTQNLRSGQSSQSS
jgi:16S rRNA (adenine1518-N6/adenine1519-N6)-dimethyltransferase